MGSAWTRIELDALKGSDIENYSAVSDWLSFDCICANTTAPDYENIPYDFNLRDLSNQHFTCSRCGRQYRVHAEVIAEMYEPLALRFPNVKDKMPVETLGLRVEE